MKNAFVIAAIAVVLGVTSTAANAQNYIVNGHTASQVEVQNLVLRGVPPGHWSVNGFGISAVVSQADTQALPTSGTPKCRYVLDVLLCD